MTSETIQEAVRTSAFVGVGLLLPQVLGYMIYRWSWSKAIGFKVCHTWSRLLCTS
jgi:hypothetical protein